MYPHRHPHPHPHPGEGVAFEPQLVLFEFLSGMMLRQQQVSLLGTFLAAHERRAPLCHQMLMGAGKTTVLAPLLTLLLAQPGVLVMECVPTSLLHFSRTVLWRAFSSQLMPRPLFRFAFHRTSILGPELMCRFERAAIESGVMITTPTDVKSIALKLLELTQQLSRLHSQPDALSPKRPHW